ncbi:MAG TPA: DUF2600 family protein [Conexibacter sp.]|jgi:tetraprenyl-beta-curcumene synthase|nr:DUF2600 family protein [Conexibacter sp.]
MVIFAVVRSLALFAFVIVPGVRVQLRVWERVAQAIPDPMLRAQALDSLQRKASNAEAAAVFSTVAPRRGRGDVVALLVALQVLTDFLDTVSETAVPDPLRNSAALHAALVDAVQPGTGSAMYYRHHPQRDDGGYVAQLVECCQRGVQALPAREAIRPFVVRAARRCGAGQSYTHEAIHRGPGRLVAWASVLVRGTDYRWWEAAAGASSSVAVHALVAAAADPRMTPEEAERVDATYYLGVGCLTVLLDNLVDREADATDGAHSYLDYYGCAAEAASRLAAIVELAGEATRSLRGRRRHEVILAGVLGFYLSAPGVRTDYARLIRTRVLERAGPAVWPILLMMRARRRFGT